MRTFHHREMSILLNLEGTGAIIYKLATSEKEIKALVGWPRRRGPCPRCGKHHSHLHANVKRRRIRHGRAAGGQQIILEYRGRRYRCGCCGKTWTERPPERVVRPRQRISRICEQQSLRDLRQQSFGQASVTTGLSYGTLRNNLHRFMSSKPLISSIPDGEISLGLDGHSRRGRVMSLTVALLAPERRLWAILPTVSRKSFTAWVHAHLNTSVCERITSVSMDMDDDLRRWAEACFPNTRIVIDRFHVVAYLNRLVAERYKLLLRGLSSSEREQLPRHGSGLIKLLYRSDRAWDDREHELVKGVFKVLPKLAEQWYWKEEVRDIYWECTDRDEARERWQEVLTHLPEVARKTLSSRLENILNFFEQRMTNGFTEGVHTKCKLIKRLSFGLKNPQVYVEKLSLAFVKPKLLLFPHTY